jgi:hypothetical protein
LICDAGGNTQVSHDSFDASAESRASKGGAAVARGRDRHGGGGHGVVAHVWLVAAASLSLPRTGASRGACTGSGRDVDYDHAQDAGEPCGRSAGARQRARRYGKRGGQAGRGVFLGGISPTWLSCNRCGAPSNSSSPLTGCSPPSSNWPTTFWFPIVSGWSVARR